jgi:hypothetical protein
MSSRLQSVSRFFGVLAVLISSRMAYAQFGRPGFVAPPKAAEAEPFSGKGKIQMVVPAPKGEVVMLMSTEKGETWALKFGKSSKLRVKAKGTAEDLRPGMVVRFDAMYDKKRKMIKDDVKKLLVCGAFPEYSAGTYQDPTAPAAGGELESDFKNTQLTGRLMSGKGSKLMMVGPDFRVNFGVAEGAQVDFDVNFSLGENYVGDDIQVSGSKGPLPQFGQAGAGGRPGMGAASGAGGYGMARGRGRGRMAQGAGQGAGAAAGGQAAAAGQAAAPAGGQAAAGQAAAGGFGATPAMPSGLISVTEATITKAQAPAAKAGHESASEKPRRGRKSAEKAEKTEKPEKKEK